MRRRLWFSSFAVAVVAVLIVGVPALVVGAGRGAAALAMITALMVVAAALAGWLTAVLAGRLARPVEELAEAAARLGPATRARSAAGTGWPISTRWPTGSIRPHAGSAACSPRIVSSRWTPRTSCALR